MKTLVPSSSWTSPIAPTPTAHKRAGRGVP
jgi:hypothetical protein